MQLMTSAWSMRYSWFASLGQVEQKPWRNRLRQHVHLFTSERPELFEHGVVFSVSGEKINVALEMLMFKPAEGINPIRSSLSKFNVKKGSGATERAVALLNHGLNGSDGHDLKTVAREKLFQQSGEIRVIFQNENRRVHTSSFRWTWWSNQRRTLADPTVRDSTEQSESVRIFQARQWRA